MKLRYNFGASGELQKQIEAGAPVDLFVSAAQRQMDELEQKELILPASRRVFARNVLVVIKPADSRLDLAKPADLLDAAGGPIVIGNPKTVPVGQYAEESLRALGLWDRLQPKLVFSENVRQALDYVARGEVDAGFVYTTDAAVRTQSVKEAFRPARTPIARSSTRRGGGGVEAGRRWPRRSSSYWAARRGGRCSPAWASSRRPPARADRGRGVGGRGGGMERGGGGGGGSVVPMEGRAHA